MKNKLRAFYHIHSSALLFWFMFFALYFPLLSFVFVTGLILVYIFWPLLNLNIHVPAVNQSRVVMIFHGLKDDDSTWAKQLKTIIETQNENTQAIAIDWSEYAGNAFTCAVNGRRIGRFLAEQVMNNALVKSVDLIGHSCGAFVSYGFCERYKEMQPKTTIQATYLDPVSIYGGIFWQFGRNHFGLCADKSMTYFDTEDNVPGSNSSPIYSKGLDVTSLKYTKTYQGTPHKWPIYYYMNLLTQK